MAYRRPRQPTTILWKPAISEWGKILGTLSNQIDLQTALDAKVSNPLTEALDFAGYEALNFITQSVDTLPDPAVAGRMVRLSTDNNLYFGKIT